MTTQTQKHTPGPWRASHWHDVIFGAYDEHGCASRVADVAEGEEREANARLIAAAPDLLEALKEAVDNLEMQGVNAPRYAYDAIAKAEGRDA